MLFHCSGRSPVSLLSSSRLRSGKGEGQGVAQPGIQSNDVSPSDRRYIGLSLIASACELPNPMVWHREGGRGGEFAEPVIISHLGQRRHVAPLLRQGPCQLISAEVPVIHQPKGKQGSVGSQLHSQPTKPCIAPSLLPSGFHGFNRYIRRVSPEDEDSSASEPTETHLPRKANEKRCLSNAR